MRQVFIAELKNASREQIEAAKATRPIKVCIVGVVVGVAAPADINSDSAEGRRPVGYHVDDGTGVIKVVHFLQDRIRRQGQSKVKVRLERARKAFADKKQDGSIPERMRKQLGDMLTDAKERLEESRVEMSVGDCVEVRGRVQRYRDENEVLAFNVRKVEDPNDEVDRVIRMQELSDKGIYAKDWLNKNSYC